MLQQVKRITLPAKPNPSTSPNRSISAVGTQYGATELSNRSHGLELYEPADFDVTPHIAEKEFRRTNSEIPPAQLGNSLDAAQMHPSKPDAIFEVEEEDEWIQRDMDLPIYLILHKATVFSNDLNILLDDYKKGDASLVTVTAAVEEGGPRCQTCRSSAAGAIRPEPHS